MNMNQQPFVNGMPQGDMSDGNIDNIMKLRKQKAMTDMLEQQMGQQQAPNLAGGIAGALGGLALGFGKNQYEEDFKKSMKNGDFGQSGVGLLKYL